MSPGSLVKLSKLQKLPFEQLSDRQGLVFWLSHVVGSICGQNLKYYGISYPTGNISSKGEALSRVVVAAFGCSCFAFASFQFSIVK